MCGLLLVFYWGNKIVIFLGENKAYFWLFFCVVLTLMEYGENFLFCTRFCTCGIGKYLVHRMCTILQWLLRPSAAKANRTSGEKVT